uniref:Uncharacterized protein n=1 Tax=Anguilla anguilla TaxID=7936 RepID=A0A0E9QM46_ANGAN
MVLILVLEHYPVIVFLASGRY